jgi:GNAT superfamily N-acetyltransferase
LGATPAARTLFAVDTHVIDPRDDAAFAGWYAVVDAAQRDLFPHESGWLPTELRAEALAEDGDERVELLTATDENGRVVGAAKCEAPLRDNTHLVSSELWVHPGHRRRGAGRALLVETERRALAAGRTVSLVEQEEPADADPGFRGFAGVHGYKCAQLDHRRDLDLPVDPARLDRIEEECLPRAGGYRIATWRDRCPDEYVDDQALLGRRMSTDMPLGDLAVEEEEWDAARVRRHEALARARGRSSVVAGAVDATGRLVAVTEIQVPGAAPERAYQGTTVVLGEHRGHRLGVLVKVANLRALAEAFPATTSVTTWNAEDNSYMVAVNETLGFRVVGTVLEWQKHL